MVSPVISTIGGVVRNHVTERANAPVFLVADGGCEWAARLVRVDGEDLIVRWELHGVPIYGRYHVDELRRIA